MTLLEPIDPGWEDPWSGPEGPRRKRIAERLADLAPVAAPLWEDACRVVMNTSRFNCERLFIGHAMRELESVLFAVLIVPERLSAPESDGGNEDQRPRNIDRVVSALGIETNSDLVAVWKGLCPHQLAHRSGLHLPLAREDVALAFAQFTDVLEVVSLRWEHRFSQWLARLDELRALEQPTGKDATYLMQRIPHNYSTLSYLFNGLDNPAWASMRAPRVLFERPPQVEYDEDAQTIRFWPWPQGTYLARVATAEPDQVTRFVETWPVGTNPFVLADVARIGSALVRTKPTHALRIASVLRGWIAVLPSWVRQSQLRELYTFIGELAAIGAHDEAFALARDLLAPLPDPESEASRASGLLRVSIGRLDFNDYSQAVDAVIAHLRSHVPSLDLLKLMVGLLDRAASMSPPLAPEGDRVDRHAYTSDDASTNWRPSLDNDHRARRDVRNVLVDAVRDLAIEIVDRELIALRVVLSQLASRDWAIVRRLGLHLLRTADEPDLIVEWLCDRDLLDDEGVIREYALLAQHWFKDIPQKAQQQILGWIEAGPVSMASATSGEHDLNDKSEQSEFLRRWRLRRLQPIADQLPAQWRDRYVGWASIGPWPDPFAIPKVSVTSVEPVGPVDEQTMHSMSVHEMIELCATYKSEDGAALTAPSERGLAAALRGVVAMEPTRFASKALLFQALQPDYVCELITGLNMAVRRHPRSALDWEPVIGLILAVAEGNVRDATPPDEWGRRGGRNWTHVRRVSAELLVTGFGLPYEATSNDFWDPITELSSRARSQVLAALSALSVDPDPGPDLVGRLQAVPAEYGSGMDHPAMQTTRALALEAIINFAWWLHRHGFSEPGVGVTSAPDVQELLDARLEPQVDRSPFVYAIFGLRFERLLELDQDWASSSSASIFGDAQGVDDRQREAWRAYLHSRFHSADGSCWAVLQDRYRLAIDSLSSQKTNDSNDKSAGPLGDDEVIACDLTELYREGIVPLRGGLLEKLFKRSAPRARATALACAVPTSGPESHVAPEVNERLRALCEWRLETLEDDAGSEQTSVEVGGFTSWFISDVFDDEWVLNQLLRALGASGRWADLPTKDPRALWRLAHLAANPTYTSKVMACVSLLLDGKFVVQDADHVLAEIVRSGYGHAPTQTDPIANVLAHRIGPAFLNLVPE